MIIKEKHYYSDEQMECIARDYCEFITELEKDGKTGKELEGMLIAWLGSFEFSLKQMRRFSQCYKKLRRSQ